MLGSVIAARGRKYLMMNAPATKLAELEDLLPGLESPSVIPLAHAGDDRDPLGRRRGRGLGPAAAAQGRRRVGDPRPADREDPPVTALGDPAGAHAPPARPARARRGDDPRARRAVPARRRPGSRRPRRGPRDPRRRPRARRRRRPRRRRALRRRAARRAPAHRPRRAAAAAATRLPAAERAALETAIANVRRFAETQRPPPRPARRSSTASSSSAAGSRSRRAGVYAPGGSAPYPSSLVMGVVPARVAGVDTIVVASPADRDGNVAPGPARRGRPARRRRAARRGRRPGDRRARLRARRRGPRAGGPRRRARVAPG